MIPPRTDIENPQASVKVSRAMKKLLGGTLVIAILIAIVSGLRHEENGEHAQSTPQSLAIGDSRCVDSPQYSKNLCVGGATIVRASALLKVALAAKTYDVVVIYVGVGTCAAGDCNVARAMKAIERMLSMVRATGAWPVLVTDAPIRGSPWEPDEREFSEQLRTQERKLDQSLASVIDSEALAAPESWCDVVEEGGLCPTCCVHPGPAMRQKIYAEAMRLYEEHVDS
jgi:hypothetical protein